MACRTPRRAFDLARNSLLALAGGLAAAICVPALGQSAQAPVSQNAAPSAFTFSGNVALASEYRTRGLMQTSGKPAIQGGVDLSHSSGFYLGNWNSSITWLSDSDDDVSAPIEMDFYGGYTTKVWNDLGIDIGAIRYYYPGHFPAGYVNPDTTEIYLGFGYGPVTFKYSHAITNLFGIPDSKNSQYYDLKGSFATGFMGTMVDAHVGYQKVKGLADASYADWLLGVSKSWSSGVSLSLAYIDTDAKRAVYTNPQGKYIGRSTLLLSVSKKF